MTRVWRAEAGEAATVAALLAGFRDWLGRDTPTAESMTASVGRLIAERDTEYLLGSVRAGEPPDGVCQLRFRFGVWYAAEDCWLEDLFVRERARGAGLGAALVESALARASERGCGRVELDVNEGNGAALALYEGLGFSAAREAGMGRSILLRRRL